MRRLLLVRHGPTRATRGAAFPTDEPLDQQGRVAAAGLADALPPVAEVRSSPALRCLQTADAAGVSAAMDPALAECDFGRWSGRTLAEVSARDPDAARAWMLDPEAAPHGGESLTVFAQRVGSWLDRESAGQGTAIAITHGGVVKAAVVHALSAPLPAFWRIEVAPLSITELQGRDGGWTVTRVNWLLPSDLMTAPGLAGAT